MPSVLSEISFKFSFTWSYQGLSQWHLESRPRTLMATQNPHYFTPTQSIIDFKNLDGFLWRSGKKLPIFEILFFQPKQNNYTDWESRKAQNLSWGLIFFVTLAKLSTCIFKREFSRDLMLVLVLPDLNNNLDIEQVPSQL